MCRRLLSALFAAFLLLGLTLPAVSAQPASATVAASAWQSLPSTPPADVVIAPEAVETTVEVALEPVSLAEAIDATPAATGFLAVALPLRHIAPAGVPAGVAPAPFLGGLLRPPSWR